MKMNIKSIRYGAFILTVGNICSQLLGFVYRIALSRLIGSEGMGLFQLIFPFYSLALTITVSGIGVAVSKLTAEYMALRNYEAIRMLVKRAIIVFVCIFSVLSLIVLLFAKGIANVFLGDERTLLAIYALLPVILLTGIENIHKHFFYGSREFNPPALSDLLEQIIRMSAVLLLLRLLLPQPDELMLVIIVTGMLICEIFSSVFLKTVYRHRMRKMPSTGKVESRLSARIGKIAVYFLSRIMQQPVIITYIYHNPQKACRIGYVVFAGIELIRSPVWHDAAAPEPAVGNDRGAGPRYGAETLGGPCVREH